MSLKLDSESFKLIPNSHEKELYGPRYDILKLAQLTETKQSSLDVTEFCKINNLGYTYLFNVILEPKLSNFNELQAC